MRGGDLAVCPFPAAFMIYNGDGELYEIRNFRTGRASFFAYDHAGRCMESLERSFTCTYEIVYDENNHPSYKEYTVTSYGTVISSYAYQYDVCNNLTKLTCSVAGSTWDTVYTYDADNRPLTTTLSSGKVITNTYDKLGRISKRSIGLNTAYETNLTYIAGYHANETTSLIATYQNGSDAAYSYSYDDVGNITAITQGSTSITYVYDSANRLTRENNQVTNQTVTYEYDSWGNILNKKVYAYTTGDLTNATYTQINYAYTNTTWGDQLTSYNGSTIVYDSMGNPTTYRGYAMTWRGKQLTGASDGTDTLSFEYNEDGLRQKKTVNNVDTDYFYNGSVLIGMQRGTDKLLFSYDASGSVVSVDYNGDEYYYLRNAQGDIVKLIDSSGTVKVQYTYDTWGKKVTTTGTLASTLGTLQPFRYRGYVYDEETGLYYLQSRYYDPTTGRFISADVYLTTDQGVIGNNTFAYCGDNPVNRIDSEGQFWNIVVGAIVGTIAGAVSSIVSQAKSGEGINWGKVALSAGVGAVTGAVAGATLGIGLAVAATGTAAATVGGAAIAVAGGALASAGGEALNQVIDHGRIDDGKAIIREGVIGGLSNLLGFGIGNLVGKAYNSTRAVFKGGNIQVLDTMVETFKAQTVSEKIISLHLSSISTPLSYVVGNILFDKE